MRTAVSFLRWSTKGQRLGHSETRQLEKADAYVRENDLFLLDHLVFDGVSGFRGTPLQQLVSKVTEGDLSFDILLVEALDRLTRQSPRRAFAKFNDLLDYGIEIVTFNPFRIYTAKDIDKNPWGLMETLMSMILANQESERKSGLNSEKWAQRRTMITSEDPADVLTARSYGWLRCVEDDDGKRWFEPIPERAEIVEWIWNEKAAGRSQESIVHDLNKRDVPCFGNGKRVGKMWRNSHVRAILKSKAPGGILETGRVEWVSDDLGRYQRRRVDMVEVPNRLPPIVDEAVFIRVQAMMTQRASRVVRAVGIQSTLAGLTTCALCGSSMTRVQKGKNRGRPRLVCAAAKHRKGCVFKTVRLEEVEEAVFERAIRDWPSAEAIQEDIDELGARAFAAAGHYENLLRVAVEAPTPEITAGIRQLEAEERHLRAQVQERERRAAALREVRAQEIEYHWRQDEPDIARINALARTVWETIIINVETRTAVCVWKSLSVTTTVEF